MFLTIYVALYRLESLSNNLINILLIFCLQSFFWAAFGFWLACNIFKESVQGHNISLLVLFIISANFLHSVVGELHIYLILLRQLWIVLDVFTRARTHVAFLVNKHFAIRRIKQHPLPYVELALEVKHWFFHQLLDYKREVFHFFLIFVVWICVGMLLWVGVVVLIVKLKYRCLVPGTSAYAVVRAHDIS